MERSWWKEAVVYQIYPKSFQDSNGDGVGDIRGIISRLDYIRSLGVTVIWLSPVYQSPNVDNGYDISDYCDIMDQFGTMDDFDELLQEAHNRGLKIVMDIVANHTSDQHKWFLESRSSKDNPYRDYYIWKPGKDGKEPTNWGSFFGGSAWQYDPDTDEYYLHQFAKEQPDLNWENPVVRKQIYDMMRWWCDKGVDGFRFDVISLISKPEQYEDGQCNQGEQYCSVLPFTSNGHRVHDFLQEMNREVLSRYDLLTVGEAAGVTLEEAKKYAGFDSKELNMVFQFEHVEAPEIDSDAKLGKWTMKEMSLPALKRVMSRWQTGLYRQAWNSLFWDNHDQPRIVSRWGNDSDRWRAKSAKCLAATLHFLQGTPYVFQGEELGMTNMTFTDLSQCDDVETKNWYKTLVEEQKIYSHEQMMQIISKRGRDNARTPMQWDDTEKAGFTKGEPWLQVNENYHKINAKAQENDPESVLHFYRKLIAIRKKLTVVTEGEYVLLEPDHDKLWCYERILRDAEKIGSGILDAEPDHLLIAANWSEESCALPEEISEKVKIKAEVVLTNMDEINSESIEPYGVMVLRLPRLPR